MFIVMARNFPSPAAIPPKYLHSLARLPEKSPMGNFVGRSMQQHAQIDITVHWDLAELREDWMTLQSAGATTLYQTYEWCHAWHDTIGMPNGVQAQIVAGHGTDGKIKFI
ncbi:MAG: hypothetical protein OER56_14335, partial [Hyphomicrobiales bacterium]|nr:hypothetical protein [Hyphomicrobiales bacterium]